MDRMILDKIERDINLARVEIGGQQFMLPANIIPIEAIEGDEIQLVVSKPIDIKSNVISLEDKLFK